MKRMKLLLIVSLVTLFAPAYGQVNDKDAMVRKIFTVLQQKDEEGFVKLFPDAATSRKFLLKILAGVESEELDEIMAELTDSSMQREFRKTFSEIMAQGEQKGIDWSQTRLISFLADSSFDEEIKMTKLNGKIYFNTGKKEYFMIYDEVIWFEDLGWYGVDIGRIDEKSKENEPEEFDRRMDEDSVLLMMVNTVAMPDTSMKKAEETKPVKPTDRLVRGKSQMSAKKPE